MKDSRIDEYIANAEPFAQPIMKQLRKLIHKANPEVQETIKWGMPSFDYKGPFVSFASFKQHVSFGFWKAALMSDPDGYLQERSAQGGDAMGNFGRLTALADLPPDEKIIELIRQAKKLNDDGVKMPARPKKEPEELVIPDYFTKAVNKNKAAKATFEAFSYSNKKEYVNWVTEAKTEKTRDERMATSVEWMSEGKVRLWKYAKKG